MSLYPICSYNRCVLITGTFSMGKDRNGSHTMVLITGVLITGIFCIISKHIKQNESLYW